MTSFLNVVIFIGCGYLLGLIAFTIWLLLDTA